VLRLLMTHNKTAMSSLHQEALDLVSKLKLADLIDCCTCTILLDKGGPLAYPLLGYE
jgi:hypothetical protein